MVQLDLRSVSVVYAAGTPWERCALDGVNFTARAGDRILVVGENGSGKSTLLSLLAGLIVPTTGSCLLDGLPITEQPGRIGLLIQNTRLQLHRPTVREELDDMAKNRSDISGVVRQLELGSLLHRRIDELSGGQQRRIGLAGAILRNADLILLDEPLAGLDRRSALGLVDSLEAVRPDSIMVVVTHDLEATSAVLEHGSGRILRIHDGRIEERERL